MNQFKLRLLVALLGMGTTSMAFAADKAAQKERIEDRADQKKDQIDRTADRQKAKVDNDAERAKDRVDGRNDGRVDSRDVNKTDRDGKVVAQPKTTVGEEITDTWITTKVKGSFVGEDGLKGSDISVDTENKGVVTLSGTAPTAAARVRAGSIASTIKGVRSVRNDIRVGPARTDAERAQDRVDGKVVAQPKTSVGEEITDTWITTKVKGSFVGEDALKGSDISVDTESKGLVTLTGTAPTAAARVRAASIAATIKGVRSVRNDIRVGPGRTDAERAKDRVDGKEVAQSETNVGKETTDTWITTKVKSSLVGVDALKGSDISVDTESKGVVTLTGTAPTAAARVRAGSIASTIKGVRSVRNDIRVGPARTDAELAKDRVNGKEVDDSKINVGEEITDTWITTKVKGSFVGEDALKGSDISVDTENKGVVKLSGTAPTGAARLRAASIATTIKGVRSVRNDIRVAPQRSDAERAKDRVDGRNDGRVAVNKTDRDGKVVANPKMNVGEEVTDSWITTKVKGSFVGEDALKGSDISVDTEDKGVVKLTGTVPTSSARLRAASIAATIKGVRSVRNDLRVAPAR